MKNYIFEGRTEEEVILKSLKELNVKEDEMIYSIKEETYGLLKKKKYTMNVVLKSDVLEYSKEYIKMITKAIGIDVNLETKRTNEHLKIILYSENNALLIGKNGKNLQSIQTLLRQSILTKTGIYVNLILDVENYKEKREKNIEYLAKKIAKEVEQTKIEVKMDSMNSYERRIVHNILSNNKKVTTISEGEEPNRYVIVKPVD